MTDRPTHPNFYLKRAEAFSRNIRAWVERQSKPAYKGYTSSSVPFVMDNLDELDRLIASAIESAEQWRTVAPTRKERSRIDLSVHRLETLENLARQIGDWVHAVRWSPGATAEDLVTLEAIRFNIYENTRHLLAQAQEQELAR